MDSGINDVLDRNHYLDDGLTDTLKKMFIDAGVELPVYIERGVLVRVFRKMSWANITFEEELGIVARLLFNGEEIKRNVDVKIVEGDDLHTLSNDSMGRIRNKVIPMFEEIILEVKKKKGIKSLINKL